MAKFHLMTMGLNSIEPCYHGLVEITDDGLVLDECEGEKLSTPIEDFGCWYYKPESEPFPTDRKWMFNKFLSLMDD